MPVNSESEGKGRSKIILRNYFDSSLEVCGSLFQFSVKYSTSLMLSKSSNHFTTAGKIFMQSVRFIYSLVLVLNMPNKCMWHAFWFCITYSEWLAYEFTLQEIPVLILNASTVLENRNTKNIPVCIILSIHSKTGAELISTISFISNILQVVKSSSSQVIIHSLNIAITPSHNNCLNLK
jgi:hypothetical protein